MFRQQIAGGSILWAMIENRQAAPQIADHLSRQAEFDEFGCKLLKGQWLIENVC